MDPTQYGPPGWVFIHALAGNSTEEPKRNAFVQWLKLLPAVFPCEICAAHLTQTMKTYPIERFADSAENLLKYTYILHDSANNDWNSSNPEKQRKVSPPWQDVKDMYLSIPTPPAERVAPITLPAASVTPIANTPLTLSVTHAPRSGSRMTISHPAFQQLKSNFHAAGRRW